MEISRIKAKNWPRFTKECEANFPAKPDLVGLWPIREEIEAEFPVERHLRGSIPFKIQLAATAEDHRHHQLRLVGSSMVPLSTATSEGRDDDRLNWLKAYSSSLGCGWSPSKREWWPGWERVRRMGTQLVNWEWRQIVDSELKVFENKFGTDVKQKQNLHKNVV